MDHCDTIKSSKHTCQLKLQFGTGGGTLFSSENTALIDIFMLSLLSCLLSGLFFAQFNIYFPFSAFLI